jgi:hypothetical protein
MRRRVATPMTQGCSRTTGLLREAPASPSGAGDSGKQRARARELKAEREEASDETHPRAREAHTRGIPRRRSSRSRTLLTRLAYKALYRCFEEYSRKSGQRYPTYRMLLAYIDGAPIENEADGARVVSIAKEAGR